MTANDNPSNHSSFRGMRCAVWSHTRQQETAIYDFGVHNLNRDMTYKILNRHWLIYSWVWANEEAGSAELSRGGNSEVPLTGSHTASVDDTTASPTPRVDIDSKVSSLTHNSPVIVQWRWSWPLSS